MTIDSLHTTAPTVDEMNLDYTSKGFYAHLSDNGYGGKTDGLDQGGHPELHGSFNAHDSVVLEQNKVGGDFLDVTTKIRDIACENGTNDGVNDNTALHDDPSVVNAKPWERTRKVFDLLMNSPADKFVKAKEEFNAYLEQNGFLTGPPKSIDEIQKEYGGSDGSTIGGTDGSTTGGTESQGFNWDQLEAQVLKEHPEDILSPEEQASLITPGPSFAPFQTETPSDSTEATKPTHASAADQPKQGADPGATISAVLGLLEIAKVAGSTKANHDIQHLKDVFHVLPQTQTEPVVEQPADLKFSPDELAALDPHNRIHRRMV